MDLLLCYFIPKVAAWVPDSPKTVDSNKAETNPFNSSHFDRFREQNIIKPGAPTIAGNPDALRTNNGDRAETNPFNKSHFDRL